MEDGCRLKEAVGKGRIKIKAVFTFWILSTVELIFQSNMKKKSMILISISVYNLREAIKYTWILEDRKLFGLPGFMLNFREL